MGCPVAGSMPLRRMSARSNASCHSGVFNWVDTVMRSSAHPANGVVFGSMLAYIKRPLNPLSRSPPACAANPAALSIFSLSALFLSTRRSAIAASSGDISDVSISVGARKFSVCFTTFRANSDTACPTCVSMIAPAASLRPPTA